MAEQDFTAIIEVGSHQMYLATGGEPVQVARALRDALDRPPPARGGLAERLFRGIEVATFGDADTRPDWRYSIGRGVITVGQSRPYGARYAKDVPPELHRWVNALLPASEWNLVTLVPEPRHLRAETPMSVETLSGVIKRIQGMARTLARCDSEAARRVFSARRSCLIDLIGYTFDECGRSMPATLSTAIEQLRKVPEPCEAPVEARARVRA